jgi:uncharacterized cupin superfamily protein
MTVAHAADLDWETVREGDTRFRRKRLSAAAAGRDLGCSLYELPPEQRSWPFHYHTGNEEALYVLEGSGLLRVPDGEVGLEPDTYVALPEGESGAHRVINDGEEVLQYLAISTMRDPDVTVYPDTDRIGVFAGSPPGGTEPRDVNGYYSRDETVDYWEGEEAD